MGHRPQPWSSTTHSNRPQGQCGALQQVPPTVPCSWCGGVDLASTTDMAWRCTTRRPVVAAPECVVTLVVWCCPLCACRLCGRTCCPLCACHQGMALCVQSRGTVVDVFS